VPVGLVGNFDIWALFAISGPHNEHTFRDTMSQPRSATTNGGSNCNDTGSTALVLRKNNSGHKLSLLQQLQPQLPQQHCSSLQRVRYLTLVALAALVALATGRQVHTLLTQLSSLRILAITRINGNRTALPITTTTFVPTTVPTTIPLAHNETPSPRQHHHLQLPLPNENATTTVNTDHDSTVTDTDLSSHLDAITAIVPIIPPAAPAVTMPPPPPTTRLAYVPLVPWEEQSTDIERTCQPPPGVPGYCCLGNMRYWDFQPTCNLSSFGYQRNEALALSSLPRLAYNITHRDVECDACRIIDVLWEYNWTMAFLGDSLQRSAVNSPVSILTTNCMGALGVIVTGTMIRETNQNPNKSRTMGTEGSSSVQSMQTA
jgi:hypothetical protein